MNPIISMHHSMIYFMFDLIVKISSSNFTLFLGVFLLGIILYRTPSMIIKKEKMDNPHSYVILDLMPIVSVAMLTLLVMGKYNPTYLLDKNNLGIIILSGFTLTAIGLLVTTYVLPKCLKLDSLKKDQKEVK